MNFSQVILKNTVKKGTKLFLQHKNHTHTSNHLNFYAKILTYYATNKKKNLIFAPKEVKVTFLYVILKKKMWILTNVNSEKSEFWQMWILKRVNSEKSEFWKEWILKIVNSGKSEFWKEWILKNGKNVNSEKSEFCKMRLFEVFFKTLWDLLEL